MNLPPSPRVDLPPEMIQNYLKRRQLDLVRLKEACQARDFAPFREIGHQLKGNADSFGFVELVPIALKLEMTNEASSPEAIADVLRRFEAWLVSARA